MTSTFQKVLPAGLILDGGMGTSLITRGLAEGACAERWNLDRPDEVQGAHRGFIEAGSQVVQTNSFGGNSIALARHGLADQMETLNLAAARIARAASNRDGTSSQGPHLVAGNIGPSGTFLPPVGDADPDRLEDAFAAQASALVEGGVDYLSIETMTDLREALCALRGVRRVTDLPVTVCLTFDRKKRGFFTIMGDRPGPSAQQLADAGAHAVGANCTLGSDVLLELCPDLVEAAPVPVVMKPNAGMPEIDNGHAVYRQPPDEFGRHVAQMMRMGARAVGGCCGTTPAFISAIVGQLQTTPTSQAEASG